MSKPASTVRDIGQDWMHLQNQQSPLFASQYQTAGPVAGAMAYTASNLGLNN
jgi:hypothetical protein